MWYFTSLRKCTWDLCLLLVRAWHENKISALQFLRGGRVRVTVREPAFRDELLSNDVMIEGRTIPVTPASVHTVTVYVRDLPVELSDESVKCAFSAYGDVFSVRHAYHKDFPDLRNGNRLLLMSVRNPIPSSLNVLGFVCRTWHPGQPVKCSICQEYGHPPRACPLSGLCQRYKQPGHMARECVQARGQPRPQPRPQSSTPDPVPVQPPPCLSPASTLFLPSVPPSSPVPSSSPSSVSSSPSSSLSKSARDEEKARLRSALALASVLSRLSPAELCVRDWVDNFVHQHSVPDRLRPFALNYVKSYIKEASKPP